MLKKKTKNIFIVEDNPTNPHYWRFFFNVVLYALSTRIFTETTGYTPDISDQLQCHFWTHPVSEPNWKLGGFPYIPSMLPCF